MTKPPPLDVKDDRPLRERYGITQPIEPPTDKDPPTSSTGMAQLILPSERGIGTQLFVKDEDGLLLLHTKQNLTLLMDGYVYLTPGKAEQLYVHIGAWLKNRGVREQVPSTGVESA